MTSSAFGSDGKSSSARWPLKRAITQSGLDGTSRAILQLIADEVNDSLTLAEKHSPSRSQLALRSGFAASAVDDAIKRLAATGWLRNLNPPRTKSRWQLSIPQEIATPAAGVVAAQMDSASTPAAGQALPRQPGTSTPAAGPSTSKTSQTIQDSSGAEAVKPDKAGQDDGEQRLIGSGQDSPGFDVAAAIKAACFESGPKAEIMMRRIIGKYPELHAEAVISGARTWLNRIDLSAVRYPEAYVDAALTDIGELVRTRHAEREGRKRFRAWQLAQVEPPSAQAVIPDVSTSQICQGPRCGSAHAVPVRLRRPSDGAEVRLVLCAGCQGIASGEGFAVSVEAVEAAS